MSLQNLIKIEQNKISGLQDKIDALQKEIVLRKKRLSAVMTLYKNDGLEAKNSKTGSKTIGQKKNKTTGAKRGRADAGKLTPEAFKILQFIGTDGHTMPQILTFCESIQYKTNAINMRGMIRYWATRHNWIDSPRHGVHRLTRQGSERLTQALIPAQEATTGT